MTAGLPSAGLLGERLNRAQEVQITADALNLFDAHLRTYFQFTNATFTQYSPGREILIGIRGKF